MTGSPDDTPEEPTVDGDREETWDVSLEDLDAEPEYIEPGTPSVEHVTFVLLGILLTLAVIYRLVELVGATIA